MSALPPLLSMSARLLFVLLATSVARVLAATSDPVAPVTDPALQVPKGVTPLFDTWMRDTYVTLAADGHYYLTGTTAAPGKTHCWDWNDGIHVWRSDDLKHWEHLGLVWSLDRDATWQRTAVIVEPGQVSPARDVLDEKRRAVWAPEIHYIKSAKQWMIVACMNGERGSFILRSVSGKPEGPYENIAGNATKALFPNIDGSLFEDDDGAHDYQNGDWETHVMFWRWQKIHGEAEALRLMAKTYNEDYPAKGMVFALGNMAKRPQTWQLLGVLRLDELRQSDLFG